MNPNDEFPCKECPHIPSCLEYGGCQLRNEPPDSRVPPAPPAPQHGE